MDCIDDLGLGLGGRSKKKTSPFLKAYLSRRSIDDVFVMSSLRNTHVQNNVFSPSLGEWRTRTTDQLLLSKEPVTFLFASSELNVMAEFETYLVVTTVTDVTRADKLDFLNIE